MVTDGSDGERTTEAEAAETDPPVAAAVSSTTSPPPVSAVAVVDPERKRDLLLEARRDRVAWIDAASSPLRGAACGADGRSALGGGGMDALREVRACRSVPSAPDVAEALYGGPSSVRDGSVGLTAREAGERVQLLLGCQVEVEEMAKAKDSSFVVGGLLAGEGGEEKKDNGRTARFTVGCVREEEEFATSYQSFLHKLRAPECAELVQGMRRFVESFEDKARMVAAKKTKAGVEPKWVLGDNKELRRLASSVHDYINKTLETIRSHAQWKSAEEDEGGAALHAVRDSLESFIFSKCHGAIWSVLSSGGAGDGVDMQERLADLQFVTPKHLDIHCFSAVESDDDGGGDKQNGDAEDWWMALLGEPIQALQSMERQFSPTKMLSCIHGMYRGVNEALSSAMHSANQSGKAMPGADDLLPALILVVLCAQPSDIMANLMFVDSFAMPEQLRGEAGYAYTNLFSAVQFLRDLDYDRDDGLKINGEGADVGIASLSISPEEFRAGLEKCRKIAEEKLATSDAVNSSSNPLVGSEKGNQRAEQVPAGVRIPVHDILHARIQGEVVDIDWALKWQQERQNKTSPITNKAGHMKESDYHGLHADSLQQPELPAGFSREYTFLAMESDEIRISDLPLLLNEYRSLVRTTEYLLAERTARAAAEHKRQIELTRKRLDTKVSGL